MTHCYAGRMAMATIQKKQATFEEYINKLYHDARIASLKSHYFANVAEHAIIIAAAEQALQVARRASRRAETAVIYADIDVMDLVALHPLDLYDSDSDSDK